MKVSVIIPAYNEAGSIAETLRCILAQTYPDLEVIVVDNNSTDDTAAIARSFQVKVVSETRKGTMWACERGRREASGDIIVRMDADCRPCPEWIARGVRRFARNDISAVSGPYDYYDAPWYFRLSSNIAQRWLYPSVQYVLRYSGRGGIMVGGNSFMRAATLANAGGFNTDLVFYGDDMDTARRMSSGGIVYFDRNLIMPTSARRFSREGVFSLTAKYWYHFFRIILPRRR